MEPEILQGEPYNYKCYLFSIGETLYFLAFNKNPFPGNTEVAKIH